MFNSLPHQKKISINPTPQQQNKNSRNGKVGGGTPKLLQVVPCPIEGPE
jgi:hypothetical protein